VKRKAMIWRHVIMMGWIFKIKQLINKLLKQEIHYIGGSETLPAPLKPADEQKVIAMLKTDNAEGKKILIEHNLRLVVYIARKFENTGIGLEDLISTGTIGLIKAINTFNPEKNIKLATYASRCVENEILMFLRKNAHTKNEISLDEPLNVDWNGNELLLSDILGTENDTILKELEIGIDKELLFTVLRKLNSREKQIMELRFGLLNGQEKTQKEVADCLGISQSYISRLEKRIILRLKKEISKMI
jgi:RNA polymerase sporulation-specific sigma factor